MIKVFKNLFLIVSTFFLLQSFIAVAQEITPYKYSDEEMENGGPKYQIPQSSRFTTKRTAPDSPDIVYYFSPPHNSNFPIAILCEGSSLEDDLRSIIRLHRALLKEFMDLGVGVITLEQRGIDGDKINAQEFMENYTRSNRLSDHRTVIEHIKKYPPQGWNGKLIFLGGSEGGPLVTTLTTDYPDITLATINWVGADGFPWVDELWCFIENELHNIPWDIKLRARLPLWMPFSVDLNMPTTRSDYDRIMNDAIKNPSTSLKLLGMTYKYHADAMQDYPKTDYHKIKTPFLIVAGALDSITGSINSFVHKAQEAGAPITYRLIPDMDHNIKKKPDAIEASFAWLKDQLEKQNSSK